MIRSHRDPNLRMEFGNIYAQLRRVGSQAEEALGFDFESLLPVAGTSGFIYAGDGVTQRVISPPGVGRRIPQVAMVFGQKDDQTAQIFGVRTFTNFSLPGVAVRSLNGASSVSFSASHSLCPKPVNGGILVGDSVVQTETLNKSGWTYKAVVLM